MEKVIIGLIFLCALLYLVRRFTKNMRGGGCGCGDGCGCCSSKDKEADCHGKKS